jgi:hypothetical protein
MGWNGKSPTEIRYCISWRDYPAVKDEDVDAFDDQMRQEVAEFIEKRFNEKFAKEIEAGDIMLTV